MTLRNFGLPLLALCGLLPALAVLWTGEGFPGLRLIFVLLVIYGWQLVFALLRGQGLHIWGLVQGAFLALVLPETALFWQLFIGLSFGFVLGEAIFGGRGRSFVDPVVLSLAFLAFSFADQPWRQGPELALTTALPAALLLLASGQARLSVVLAALAAFGAASLGLLGQAPPISGLLLLTLLYPGADPVVSGSTGLSRLAYGALLGLLAALLSTTGPEFGALVFAILLAQIFAPLLDHLAVSLHRRRALARRAADV